MLGLSSHLPTPTRCPSGPHCGARPCERHVRTMQEAARFLSRGWVGHGLDGDTGRDEVDVNAERDVPRISRTRADHGPAVRPVLRRGSQLATKRIGYKMERSRRSWEMTSLHQHHQRLLNSLPRDRHRVDSPQRLAASDIWQRTAAPCYPRESHSLFAEKAPELQSQTSSRPASRTATRELKRRLRTGPKLHAHDHAKRDS